MKLSRSFYRHTMAFKPSPNVLDPSAHCPQRATPVETVLGVRCVRRHQGASGMYLKPGRGKQSPGDFNSEQQILCPLSIYQEHSHLFHATCKGNLRERVRQVGGREDQSFPQGPRQGIRQRLGGLKRVSYSLSRWARRLLI